MKFDLLVDRNKDKSIKSDLTAVHTELVLLVEDILSKDSREVITPWTSLSQLLSSVLLDAILFSITLDLLELVLLEGADNLSLAALYR
jgi:hypothetical protein